MYVTSVKTSCYFDYTHILPIYQPPTSPHTLSHIFYSSTDNFFLYLSKICRGNTQNDGVLVTLDFVGQGCLINHYCSTRKKVPGVATWHKCVSELLSIFFSFAIMEVYLFSETTEWQMSQTLSVYVTFQANLWLMEQLLKMSALSDNKDSHNRYVCDSNTIMEMYYIHETTVVHVS